METWVGVDIGGAHIKLASQTNGIRIPFALWKQPEKLPAMLGDAFSKIGSFDRIAVTMTGELADCFESKSTGVAAICDAVMQVGRDKVPVFYQTTGQFVDHATATTNWLSTAAANWHAMASFVGRRLANCIVIDIGSTTTDITPVENGVPVNLGNTDLSRLQSNELVYSGVTRTPVCAVAHSVPVTGIETWIAAELFATMLDVYLILDRLPTSTENEYTADGRPANKESAFRRLAKMVCADLSEISKNEIANLAREVAARQRTMLADSVEVVAARHRSASEFVILGQGAWLAEEILTSIGTDYERIFLMDNLIDGNVDKRMISEIGPAFALVQLAASQSAVKHSH